MSAPKDLAIDLGEVAVDILLEDGIIKEIPILRSLYGFASIAVSIPDRIFAAKTRRFLNALPEISNEARIKFIADIESDSKRKERLAEIVLLSLDRTDRLRKTELLAKLFFALLNDRISDSEFDSLTNAICQSDLSQLDDFLEQIDKHDMHDPPLLHIGYEQLIGAGLTRSNGTPSFDQSGTFTRSTKLGLTLYRILYTDN